MKTRRTYLTKTMCSVTLEIVKFKKSVEIDSGLCCSERWEFWYWGETEIPITADRFSKPRAAVHCLRCSMRSSAKSLNTSFSFCLRSFQFIFYFILFFGFTRDMCVVLYFVPGIFYSKPIIPLFVLIFSLHSTRFGLFH